MIGRWWNPWTRLLLGAAVLAVLVSRVGTAPFLRAVASVDLPLLGAAALLTLLASTCAAWRWRLVADGLGVPLRLPAALAAYYQSQLVNLTLPGGVVGDVHRGIVHGRAHAEVGLGLRAVAWERVAGQVVQVALTVSVLLLLPTPLRAAGVVLLAVAAVLLTLGTLALVAGPDRRRRSRWLDRIRRAVVSDLRLGVLRPGAWARITLASALAVACHVVTFALAARAAGAAMPWTVVVPVAMLVLTVAAVPANLAGWGPREGAAAAAFAAVGLDPATGVTVSSLFGVMVLVAALPGGFVVAATLLRGGRRRGSGAASGALPAEGVAARG